MSSKKKVVVYTSIINPKEPFGVLENYDTLKRPIFVEDSIDYICFTNNKNMISDVWDIRYYPEKFNCPTRSSREVKILPHRFLKDYDYSIFIDGSTQINLKINDFVLEKLKEYNFCIRKHDKRNCVYSEAKHLINIYNSNPKDTPENILNHIEKLKKQNFPYNYGLYPTGVLLRKHNNPDVIKCMEVWWEKYMSGSKRDQLSLPCAIFETSLAIKIMSESEHKKYFTHKKHRIKYGKIRKV